MAWIVVCAILCILVAGVVMASRGRAAISPSASARARLDREIGNLRVQVFTQRAPDDPLGAELWRVRQGRWHAVMCETPVEELEASGIGPSTYKILREHGIRTLGDLGRLDYLRVRSLGPQKRDALKAAYDRFNAELQRRIEQLSWEELDGISGGRLKALHAEATEKQRAAARVIEGARIRLAELERRRAALQGEVDAR